MEKKERDEDDSPMHSGVHGLLEKQMWHLQTTNSAFSLNLPTWGKRCDPHLTKRASEAQRR